MYQVKRKEATLFVNSEVSDSYPKIKCLLVNGHKFPCLTVSEFNGLDIEEKEFFQSNFKNVFSLAASEWKIGASDIFLPNENKECQLCGKKDLKDKFKIVNKMNGKSLVVGSSCINDYDQIKDANGKSALEIKKENKRKNNRIRNEIELSKIDGFENIVNDLEKFERLENDNFYTNTIDKNIKKCKKYYDLYCKIIQKDCIKNEKIDELRMYYLEIKDVLNEANSFLERSKVSEFGITSEMWKWCYSNNSDLYYVLKEAGVVPLNRLYELKEKKFVRKIVKKFEPLLKKNNIEVVRIESSYFSIKFKYLDKIVFDVNYSNFVQSFVKYLSEGLEYSINPMRLLPDMKIKDDKSLSAAIKLICPWNFSKIFTIKFKEEDINELVFQLMKEDKYYVVKYKEFVNTFKKNIFENDPKNNDSISMIEKYILEKGEIYEPKEYHSHLRKMRGEKDQDEY